MAATSSEQHKAGARSTSHDGEAGQKVSALVPVRELNDFGRRCIAHLLELPQSVEVVLVPDVCPDGLDPRVVCVPSGEATTGEKRQLGLERSTGEVVALIDDDAYPREDWLTNALATLEREPEAAAVCGPAITAPDDGELEQLSGRVYASPLVAGSERWRQLPRPARWVTDAPSVNLVLRAEDAAAPGFATALSWGEDTEFTNRLIGRGRRIRYEPDVVVFHSRRPLWVPHLRQLWRWARHRGGFARSGNPNSLRPSFFAPSALLLWALLGWLPGGAVRKAWGPSLAVYGSACVIAGLDRRPSRWARLTGAIAASHATYGAGFLLGLAGVRPPRA